MIEFASGLFGSAFMFLACLLPLIPFTLILVLAILGGRRARQRIMDLKEFAARNGLAFDDSIDTGHARRYREFEIFRMGDDQRAVNTISGEISLGDRSSHVVMGDYEYETTTGTGKNRKKSTTRFSYLIVEMPWSDLPEFEVRPENIFDKFAGFLGFNDIDFESDEFSRKFSVRSSDRRFAYALMHPLMMEFMLASGPPVFYIEGGRMCMTHGTLFAGSADFNRVVQWYDAFMRKWPEHLANELEEVSRWDQ